MTEVVLQGPVEPSRLQVQTRTLPAPATSQALVRIEASGISLGADGPSRSTRLNPLIPRAGVKFLYESVE